MNVSHTPNSEPRINAEVSKMSTHSDYARENHQSGVWRRWNIRDGSRWFAKNTNAEYSLTPRYSSQAEGGAVGGIFPDSVSALDTDGAHTHECSVHRDTLLTQPYRTRYRVYVTVGCPSVSPSVCPVDSSRLIRICRRHRSERPALVMWPEEEDRRRLVLQSFLVILRAWPIWNESVPKIILNITINLFLSCNQHFGNFKQ